MKAIQFRGKETMSYNKTEQPTSEGAGYPKEFVEWTNSNYDFEPKVQPNGELRYVAESDEGESFVYTLEVLYEYWKENVK